MEHDRYGKCSLLKKCMHISLFLLGVGLYQMSAISMLVLLCLQI